MGGISFVDEYVVTPFAISTSRWSLIIIPIKIEYNGTKIVYAGQKSGECNNELFIQKVLSNTRITSMCTDLMSPCMGWAKGQKCVPRSKTGSWVSVTEFVAIDLHNSGYKNML